MTAYTNAVIAVALAAAAVITSARADVQQCASIKNDKERLACFDKAVAPPAPHPAPAAKTAEMRAAYARALWHALLESGLDVKVFDQERGDPNNADADTFPVYPRLTFLGAFNAP